MIGPNLQRSITHWGTSLPLFLREEVSTFLLFAGDYSYLPGQDWLFVVTFATTRTTEAIVHCFLIYRYWKMCVVFCFASRSSVKNTPWRLVVAEIIPHCCWPFLRSHPYVNATLNSQFVLTPIVQFGAGIWSAVVLAHMHVVSQQKRLWLPIMCVFSTTFNHFTSHLIVFVYQEHGSACLWLQISPSLLHFSGNWVASSLPSNPLRGVLFAIANDTWLSSDPRCPPHHCLVSFIGLWHLQSALEYWLSFGPL